MKIEAIIFDWAGTTIDYGCFSPLVPFINAFAKHNLHVTQNEARGPMGKLKIDHIRDLMNLTNVQEQFYKQHRRTPNEGDITEIYNEFEHQVFAGLTNYVVPIPNVLKVVSELRNMGLKIGSTTGYTKQMMDIILPIAKQQGYSPDYCISSTEVPRGRPYPYMLYKNMLQLDITNTSNVVKVGDTISDILEGVNAKCISVGVIIGSSELGLSLDEFNHLEPIKRQSMINNVRYKMYSAGANYVIDEINQLPDLITAIDKCK